MVKRAAGVSAEVLDCGWVFVFKGGGGLAVAMKGARDRRLSNARAHV